MYKFIITTLLILPFTFSQAQFSDQKSWLVVKVDNNQYGSLFKNTFEGAFDFDKPSFSIGVEQYLNNKFDASAKIVMGKVADNNSTNIEVISNNNLRANFTGLEITGIFKFTNGIFRKEESKVTPYIEAGVALYNFRENSDNKDGGLAVAIPVSIGVKYRFTKNMQLVTNLTNNANTILKHKRFSVGFSFALNGKYDSDKDGIFDDEDVCPDIFGVLENQGCPYLDSDEDGVLDKDDLCPFEKGTIFGCPDQDGDGIRDLDDNCPLVAGTIDGCPDSDSDGVIDSEDKCPDEYGEKRFEGCPEIKLPVAQVLFAFNSPEIDQKYHADLNLLIDFLADNKDIIIKLSGYTDNIGGEVKNLELSINRAEAVKSFLISNGLNHKKILVNGYGMMNSIADNDTEEGRVKNRRVEIRIVLN